MQTSYFANVKKVIAAGLEPIAISAGIPRFFSGRRELRLAPKKDWLKLSRDSYDHMFRGKLAEFDAKVIFAELPENACLLCWEKPFDACHRRMVAEWLEAANGVIITEFGFERSHVPAYVNMRWVA